MAFSFDNLDMTSKNSNQLPRKTFWNVKTYVNMYQYYDSAGDLYTPGTDAWNIPNGYFPINSGLKVGDRLIIYAQNLAGGDRQHLLLQAWVPKFLLWPPREGVEVRVRRRHRI